MSWYRQQLEDWLSNLDVQADTVLDWGGKQNPVQGRTKTWKVYEYIIWDEDQDIQSTAYTKHPEKDQIGPGDRADVIFCLEVFEYLVDPIAALENIEYSLNEGGKAYVTFAFAYPHHNELELDALRYTEPGIMRMAQQVGLKVSNIWYRTDKSGLLQSFYSTDGMHPAKGYAHHDVTGFIVEFQK